MLGSKKSELAEVDVELVGVEELGVQEQIAGAPLIDRDRRADDGDLGDHGEHPAEQRPGPVHRGEQREHDRERTRKKPMFSIAFETSSE